MQFLARSLPLSRSEQVLKAPNRFWQSGFAALALLGLAVGASQLHAQAPTPAPDTPTQPATAPALPPQEPAQQPAPAPTGTVAPALPDSAGPAPAPGQVAGSGSGIGSGSSHEVTEEEVKHELVGKQLFLRGGYLGDTISFNEHGLPTGHPAIGSYTLSAVEINKVHLTRHKVELEGYRYALHFLGALPNEDPSAGIERIKTTPKKKLLRITIDREQVIKEKKAKEEKKGKGDSKAAAAPAGPTISGPEGTQPAAPDAATQAEAPVPVAEQAADPASVTTTFSPAHAAGMLRDALDHIFADGIDDKVRAQMPDFWKLYYQAQAAGIDYRPKDPAVLRSSAVERQARLTSSINPESNDYAQASGIAGRALYRAVIGVDGKAGEIAVVRPIGFGLDENAVSAIRKATFQPAMKEGHPVAETLDLAVLFRIYSKRTSVAGAASETSAEPSTKKAILPGPYTVQRPTPPPEPPPAPTPPPDPAATPAPTQPAPQA
jgi:Gram-negative bacterial TonB protein C-terminal